MKQRQVYRMSSNHLRFPIHENPHFFFRISDLIELRKLRRARQGIDVTKLHKGDAKRRQKRAREGEEGEDDEELVKPEKGIPSAVAAAVDEDEYV